MKTSNDYIFEIISCLLGNCAIHKSNYYVSCIMCNISYDMLLDGHY